MKRKMPFERLQTTFFRLRPKLSATSPDSCSLSPAVKQLPNELIEVVLEHLYFDTPALLNTALVGRAWVYPSQRGIFRKLLIEPLYNVPGPRRENVLIQSLLNINAILGDPRLASYVHSLEIHFIRVETLSTLGRVTLDAAIASIVQRLPNIRKLSLKRVVWKALSPLLKEALTDMLKLPSLKQLSLGWFMRTCSFTEVSSLLHNAIHLKVLSIVGLELWNFQAGTDLEGMSTTRPIRLDRLYFSPSFSSMYVHHLLAWLQQDHCPLDVRELRSLCIGTNGRSSLVELLRFLGTNLRKLELIPVQFFDYSDQLYVAPLEYTPNLRSLILDITQTTENHPAPWIEALLQSLPNPYDDGMSLLQHLTIKLRVFLDDANPDVCGPDLWAALDRQLEDPRFSRLKVVKFVLYTSNASSDLEAIKESFQQTLTYLKGSGKLIMRIN